MGETTRSIVGSISRSDLHQQVSQVQHINLELQVHAVLFSAQRQSKKTPHVWEESDGEAQLHRPLPGIYPFCLIPSLCSPFVFIHENK